MAAQASCPVSCPFLGAGCYAESGPQGIHTARLNKSVNGESAEGIALAEEIEIGKLSGTRPLRLHIVGDCKTSTAALIVSHAAWLYRRKHNMPVWGYTHAWREVHSGYYRINGVTMLASCETIAEVKQADSLNYRTALTTTKFKQNTAWKENGFTFVPCPEQTGKTKNCTTCKLCWHPQDKLPKTVIVFETHGVRSKTANLKITEKALCE